jgi:hypothetical protein
MRPVFQYFDKTNKDFINFLNKKKFKKNENNEIINTQIEEDKNG